MREGLLDQSPILLYNCTTMPSDYPTIRTLIRFTVENPNPSLFTLEYLQAKRVFHPHHIVDDLSFPFPPAPVSRCVFSDNYLFEAYRDQIGLRVTYLNPEEPDPDHIDDLGDAAKILSNDVAYMKFGAVEIGFDLFYADIKSLNPLAANWGSTKEVRTFVFTESLENFLATHTLSLLTAELDEDGERAEPDTAIEVSSNFYSQLPRDVGSEEAQRLIDERLSARGSLFSNAKGIVDELQLRR